VIVIATGYAGIREEIAGFGPKALVKRNPKIDDSSFIL
jgi:hypothetical protein